MAYAVSRRCLTQQRNSFSHILAMAQPMHRGYNIYHSKHDCLAVLKAMEDVKAPWWTIECSAFVEQVANATWESPLPPVQTGGRHPIIVVEGLDGVGKTTVTTALAEKLQGQLIRTPDPSLEPLRTLFRGLDEPLARAFYCGANYIAASLIADMSMDMPIVVDRWWCSTCSMAMATRNPPQCAPAGDAVYHWPQDLPAYDCGVLLHVSEEVRRLRMRKRNDENAEEALLAAKEEMRRVAMTAYERCCDGTPQKLHLVEVPNYMIAVNTILRDVMQKQLAGYAIPSSAMFTDAEIATVRPY